MVDGSNLATEGRTLPSLAQLDEAVRAYAQEDPNSRITVVVDASFEHRIDDSERDLVRDAMLNGEMVSPPAGAIGRGDAFVLRIAERTGAVVLSNDSFQEFHAEHPWLFDEGRLIGGKPVPGVGWIFTPRLPIRGPKSRAATAEARAKKDPESAPAKAAELAKAAKKAARRSTKKAAPSVPSNWPITPVTPPPAPRTRKRSSLADPALKSAISDAVAEALDPTKPPKSTKVSKKVPQKKAAAKKIAEPKAEPKKAAAAKKSQEGKKSTSASSSALASGASGAKKAAKNAAKSAAEPKKSARKQPEQQPTRAAGAKKKPSTTPPPAVNEPLSFINFVAAFPIGSTVDGEVVSFTSHGAMVDVSLPGGGTLHCYIPLSAMGSPAPTKARELLRKGEVRPFVLAGLDPPRRVAELALPAPPAKKARRPAKKAAKKSA